MMEAMFERRIAEFADASRDEAFQKYVRPDERYDLANRAMEAFWQLLESRVNPDVYKELKKAWLKVEEAQTALHLLEVDVYFLQGFADGMRMASASLPAVGTVPGRLYNPAEVLANIERIEASGSLSGGKVEIAGRAGIET